MPEVQLVDADPLRVNEYDMLLVSLYWWKDVYEYVWWCSQSRLDFAKRRPVVIVGGMGIANPAPVRPWFHYAFIGDGEVSIAALVEAVLAGRDPYGLPGVWHETEPVTQAAAETIPIDPYVENRKAAITRIEMARGCSHKCPFCQVAWCKPYREAPLADVCRLVREAPTTRIAAFAPNRSAYSGMVEVDKAILAAGKVNCAQDTRLDSLRKLPTVDHAKFGVEAFGERTRKLLYKVPLNRHVIDGILYLANELRRPNGEPMRSAECYMIHDLPGETAEDVAEFWETLRQVDIGLRERFTLFLSVSNFCPSPHTPMWHCAIHPYADNRHIPRAGQRFTDLGRAPYEKLVIAMRGGPSPAAARLCQMIPYRGDARLAPVIRWLATRPDGQACFKASGKTAHRAAKTIEAACRACGYEPDLLYREWHEDEPPPWANIRPTISGLYRWPKQEEAALA